MNTTLKLEEAGKFFLSWYLNQRLGFSWWVFPAWLLAPDLSMVGYLVNTRVGAFFYNLAHHQGVAAVIWMIGLFIGQDNIQFAGLLLFGHSSMDRIFGYGLKYPDSFKHTHLGWIGNAGS